MRSIEAGASMPGNHGRSKLGRLAVAVGLLSLAGFINFRIAMPSLVAALGGSVFFVGAVFSSVAAVRAAARILGGVVRDIKGDRLVLTLSAALRALSFLVLMLATKVHQALLGASLFAAAQGLESTALLSATAVHAADTGMVGMLFGLVLTLRMLPNTFSSLLTGLLADTYGLKAVFGAGLLLSLPALAVGAVFEERCSVGESVGYASTGVSLTKGYLLLLAATSLLFISVSSFVPLLTYWLVSQGVGLAAIGTVLFARSLLAAFSRVYSGYLADRVGDVEVLALVGAVRALALALIPHAEGLLPLAVLVVVHGSLMAAPSRSALIYRVFGRIGYGKAFGIVGLSQDLGGVVGPLLAGILAERVGYEAAFYFMALTLALYTGLMLALRGMLAHTREDKQYGSSEHH